jgi:membrane protein DedA with SNARE-associated domain
MKVINFLLAIICGRLIRYGALSALTIIFGPQIVNQTRTLFKDHPWLVLVVFVVLVIGGYIIYRLLRAPASEVAAELRHEEESRDNKNKGSA